MRRNKDMSDDNRMLQRGDGAFELWEIRLLVKTFIKEKTQRS